MHAKSFMMLIIYHIGKRVIFIVNNCTELKDRKILRHLVGIKMSRSSIHINSEVLCNCIDKIRNQNTFYIWNLCWINHKRPGFIDQNVYYYFRNDNQLQQQLSFFIHREPTFCNITLKCFPSFSAANLQSSSVGWYL